MSRLRGDDGRVSVYFAIVTLGFIALLGLLVDGGGRIRALQRADNIAAEAARTAGQAINAPVAISGGAKRVDPAAAVAAAQAYIAAAGATCPPGCVRIAPDQRHVTVTVQVVYTEMVHLGSWTVTGTATAVLVVT